MVVGARPCRYGATPRARRPRYPTREVAEGAGARRFGRAAAADTTRSGAESVRAGRPGLSKRLLALSLGTGLSAPRRSPGRRRWSG